MSGNNMPILDSMMVDEVNENLYTISNNSVSYKAGQDSAVSAFKASSVTLLKVSRVGPKPGDLRAERTFGLVVRN